MKNVEITGNHITINVRDNCRNVDWGHKNVIKILKRSLASLEKLIYSNATIITKKNNKKFSIDLLLCGDLKMKSLNIGFRSKNKTTDVLSFPLYHSLRKGSDEFVIPGELSLGDIIISRNIAKKQAKEFGLKIEEEVIHLFVHGLLHLLGYDHEVSKEEEIIMETLEKKVLTNIRNS